MPNSMFGNPFAIPQLQMDGLRIPKTPTVNDSLAALIRSQAALARALRPAGGGRGGSGPVGEGQYSGVGNPSKGVWVDVPQGDGTTKKEWVAGASPKEREENRAVRLAQARNDILKKDTKLQERLAKIPMLSLAGQKEEMEKLRKEDMPRAQQATGMSDEELTSQIMAPLQKQFNERKTAVENTGFFTTLKSMGKQVFNNVGAAIDSIGKSPEEKLAIGNAVAEANRQEVADNPWLENRARMRSEGKSTVGDSFSNWGKAIAEEAVPLAGMMAPAIVGGAIGSVIAPGPGTLAGIISGAGIGGMAGGAVGMGTLTAGETLQRVAEDPNLTEAQKLAVIDDAQTRTALTSAAIGALPIPQVLGIAGRNLALGARRAGVVANPAFRDAQRAISKGVEGDLTGVGKRGVYSMMPNATAADAQAVATRRLAEEAASRGMIANTARAIGSHGLNAAVIGGAFNTGENLAYGVATGQDIPWYQNLDDALIAGAALGVPFGIGSRVRARFTPRPPLPVPPHDYSTLDYEKMPNTQAAANLDQMLRTLRERQALGKEMIQPYVASPEQAAQPKEKGKKTDTLSPEDFAKYSGDAGFKTLLADVTELANDKNPAAKTRKLVEPLLGGHAVTEEQVKAIREQVTDSRVRRGLDNALANWRKKNVNTDTAGPGSKPTAASAVEPTGQQGTPGAVEPDLSANSPVQGNTPPTLEATPDQLLEETPASNPADERRGNDGPQTSNPRQVAQNEAAFGEPWVVGADGTVRIPGAKQAAEELSEPGAEPGSIQPEGSTSEGGAGDAATTGGGEPLIINDRDTATYRNVRERLRNGESPEDVRLAMQWGEESNDPDFIDEARRDRLIAETAIADHKAEQTPTPQNIKTAAEVRNSDKWWQYINEPIRGNEKYKQNASRSSSRTDERYADMLSDRQADIQAEREARQRVAEEAERREDVAETPPELRVLPTDTDEIAAQKLAGQFANNEGDLHSAETVPILMQLMRTVGSFHNATAAQKLSKVNFSFNAPIDEQIAKDTRSFRQDSWHSTPNDIYIDQLSTDYMSTGEGGQAHGFGVYVFLDGPGRFEESRDLYRVRLASKRGLIEPVSYSINGEKISRKDAQNNEDKFTAMLEANGIDPEMAREVAHDIRMRGELHNTQRGYRKAYAAAKNEYDAYKKVEKFITEYASATNSKRDELFNTIVNTLYASRMWRQKVYKIEDMLRQDTPDAIRNNFKELLDTALAAKSETKRLYDMVYKIKADYENVPGQTLRVRVPDNDRLLDKGGYIDGDHHDFYYSDQSPYIKRMINEMAEDVSSHFTGYRALWAADYLRWFKNDELNVRVLYDKLSDLFVREYGEDVWASKEASMLLYGYGIDGIHYRGSIDGDCAVLFNGMDTRILERIYNQAGGRGRIDYSQEGTARILFGRNADASTVIHEGTHWVIEEMERILRDKSVAEADKAQLRADMQTLRDKMGVGGVAGEGYWSVEGHERAAKSFELYMRTGKAPTSELQGLFARMRALLLQLYKRAKDILGISKLPKEVFEVFDRWLTGYEKQIAAEEKAAAKKPVQEKPEPAPVQQAASTDIVSGANKKLDSIYTHIANYKEGFDRQHAVEELNKALDTGELYPLQIEDYLKDRIIKQNPSINPDLNARKIISQSDDSTAKSILGKIDLYLQEVSNIALPQIDKTREQLIQAAYAEREQYPELAYVRFGRARGPSSTPEQAYARIYKDTLGELIENKITIDNAIHVQKRLLAGVAKEVHKAKAELRVGAMRDAIQDYIDAQLGEKPLPEYTPMPVRDSEKLENLEPGSPPYKMLEQRLAVQNAQKAGRAAANEAYLKDLQTVESLPEDLRNVLIKFLDARESKITPPNMVKLLNEIQAGRSTNATKHVQEALDEFIKKPKAQPEQPAAPRQEPVPVAEELTDQQFIERLPRITKEEIGAEVENDILRASLQTAYENDKNGVLQYLNEGRATPDYYYSFMRKYYAGDDATSREMRSFTLDAIDEYKKSLEQKPKQPTEEEINRPLSKEELAKIDEANNPIKPEPEPAKPKTEQEPVKYTPEEQKIYNAEKPRVLAELRKGNMTREDYQSAYDAVRQRENVSPEALARSKVRLDIANEAAAKKGKRTVVQKAAPTPIGKSAKKMYAEEVKDALANVERLLMSKGATSGEIGKQLKKLEKLGKSTGEEWGNTVALLGNDPDVRRMVTDFVTKYDPEIEAKIGDAVSKVKPLEEEAESNALDNAVTVTRLKDEAESQKKLETMHNIQNAGAEQYKNKIEADQRTEARRKKTKKAESKAQKKRWERGLHVKVTNSDGALLMKAAWGERPLNAKEQERLKDLNDDGWKTEPISEAQREAIKAQVAEAKLKDPNSDITPEKILAAGPLKDTIDKIAESVKKRCA